MKKYHIVKREGVTLRRKALFYLAAIFAALLFGALLLLAFGVNPLDFYGKVFTIGLPTSAFPYKQIENFINTLVPLVLTSMALSVAYKMRFWNVGGEGQFLMGATAAAAIPLKFGIVGNLFLTLLLMVMAAMAAAAVWGGITAFFKVKFGTNETLLTLMFNYVALYFVSFLGETKGAWNFFLRTDSQRPTFATVFDLGVTMPALKIGSFSLSLALPLTVLLCAFLWFYLKKTKQGYEIAVMGDSPGTARYAGMKTGWIVIRTMLLSSALIGLAGFFKLMTSGSLSPSLTDNVGWTGVVVAWLAKLEPVGIILTSILIAVLRFGCAQASIHVSAVDSRFSDVLQGVILFAVLAADFLLRFKIVKKEEA